RRPGCGPSQSGLQIQCEKGHNQVACQQWEQQKKEQNVFAQARQQQTPSTEMSGEGQLIMLVVGLIFWGGVIYGVVYLFKAARRQVRDEEFAKLPKDGPMRVNIKEEHRPAGSFNSKRYPCALHINVVISQKD